MPAMWDIADAVPLKWELFQADGTTPVDATVSVTITLPDGTTSSPAVTHAATGVYTASYTPATSGTFLFRWAATGAVTAAEDGAFRVRVAGTNLIAVQDVKDRLNKSLSLTVGNGEIQDMIDAACAEYAEWVGPLGGTVTETFDGGSTELVLRQSVSAITAASYDSGSTLTYTDLTVQNGIVRWAYGTAGRFVYGRVSITYTAPAIPANHREVIIADVAGYFAVTQRGGAGRPAFAGEAGYEDAFTGHPVELFPRIRALAASYPAIA